MLLVFIGFVFVSTPLAAITDLNCTALEGGAAKYTENAVICANVIADSVCAKLYTKEVVPHTDTEREDACYKDAAGPNEAFKEAAISTCPRRCGYCCLTPEYNCPNKLFPRISCSVITRDMCYSPAWRSIIEEDCPAVCGFCKTGNCTDIAPNCAKDISICRNLYMQDFVKEYCKKTCHLCPETNTAMTSTTATNCGTDANCYNWVRNGFCSSTFYTQEQKKAYCGRACGLC